MLIKEDPTRGLFGLKKLPKSFPEFEKKAFLPKGQYDPELYPKIQKEGCYFLALLKGLHKRFPKKIGITAKWVNETYDQLVAKKFLREDCLLLSPTGILGHLGIKGRLRTFLEGVAFPPTYQTQENELEILCFKRVIPEFTHFVTGNGKGAVEWDPIVTGSNTVRLGKLDSKRIFVFS